MQNLITGILILAFALVGTGQAQNADSGKKEARARRTEARRLLKESTILVKNGQANDAKLLLDSLLVLNSKNADAYYLMGQVHLIQSDTASAMQVIDTGISFAPLSSRLKILKARILIIQQKFDEAAPVVESILMIKPREPQALYLNGRIHLASADTTAALDAFKASLEAALAEK